MKPKQTAYKNQANTIIKGLKKRNMTGYYCNSSSEAVKLANSLIEDNKIVTWGGSMTINDIGLTDSLKTRNLTILDRGKAKTPEEVKKAYRDAFSSDYYLMSTNAITLNGELVNIDGNGNRVAALIYGPDKVIIVAGMNKVAIDVPAAIERVHNFASPANTNRLNLNTPCSTSGICHKCLSGSICCQTVITRNSRHNNRIHVILIGEELGY